MKRTSASSAFSLIELVVVLLLMGTVGSVVVACFMGGMRAYERARDFGRGEVDAYLTFEVMERDLKNMVAVPDVPFAGDSKIMQFATSVSGARVGDSAEASIAVVRYWESPPIGVFSETALFGTANGVAPEEELLVAGDVSMQLAYREEASEASAVEWSETWQNASNFPQQVRVQLSGGELGESVLERTILIPAGGQ